MVEGLRDAERIMAIGRRRRAVREAIRYLEERLPSATGDERETFGEHLALLKGVRERYEASEEATLSGEPPPLNPAFPGRVSIAELFSEADAATPVRLPNGLRIRLPRPVKVALNPVELSWFDHIYEELPLSSLQGLTHENLPRFLDLNFKVEHSFKPLPSPAYVRIEDWAGVFCLQYVFLFNAASWPFPENLLHFAERLSAALRSKGYETQEVGVDEGVFSVGVSRLDHAPGDFVDAALADLEGVKEIALELLEERTPTLLMDFDVPEAFGSACEQYLYGMGTFLSDLGIENREELSRTGQRVTVSLHIKDYAHVHETVREALALYLALPALEVGDSAAGQSVVQLNDFRTERLLLNIRHLQAQLKLAREANAAKDRALRAYDERPPGAVLQDGLQRIQEEGTRKHEALGFLGGAVELGDLECYGLRINVQAVCRLVGGLVDKHAHRLKRLPGASRWEKALGGPPRKLPPPDTDDPT